MSLTISVNQPNLPEGEPVYIQGLGLFENGSPPRQLTDEELQNWDIHNPTVNLSEAIFYGVTISDPERVKADEALLHELEKAESKSTEDPKSVEDPKSALRKPASKTEEVN